jgi:crossover junction endodeoxyribonuclease RuvC
MRILGIDPSIRGTGYGIIDHAGPQPVWVASGTIALPARMEQPLALHEIRSRLDQVIAEHRPDCAAIEKIIYVQSIRTAITMGSARGAALAACGAHGLQVTEYPAKVIKSAATGKGAARKDQVAFMVRVLLELDRTPEPDEADALAIAITHARRGKR